MYVYLCNPSTPCASRRVRTCLGSPPLYYGLPPFTNPLGNPGAAFKKPDVPFYYFEVTFFDVRFLADFSRTSVGGSMI